MTVRTLIVDDEEPARKLVRWLLTRWPDIEIVGESADGIAAVDLVHRLKPDLVFLDVQMPRLSGFDVVAALDPRAMPLIVFVTAYDQYALRAFEVSACDYLLKPFDADRLETTMRRVLLHHESSRGELHATIRSLLAEVRGTSADQVVVKADGRHVFLTPDEIEWIEAVGKDVQLHGTPKTTIVHESMAALEARLDPMRFVRVHRSAIVNRSHIREIQPWFKGDFVILLRSGARVTTGRTYRSRVQRLLDARDSGGRTR